MDINEVRESVAKLAGCGLLTMHDSDALLALLADHARLQGDTEKLLTALKDACAMHLTYLSSDSLTGTVDMVGRHNVQAAAWRLRRVLELPLDQSNAQMMTMLRTSLVLAFGEEAEAKSVQS